MASGDLGRLSATENQGCFYKKPFHLHRGDIKTWGVISPIENYNTTAKLCKRIPIVLNPKADQAIRVPHRN